MVAADNARRVPAARDRRMDIRDMIRVAAAAGFRGNDLITAVAVALAESGGNMDAVGDTRLANKTWGPSVGLWQIRTLNAQKGKGSTRDIDHVAEAFANAQSAFALYQGRKTRKQSAFSDWTMFKNGGYKKYLDQVRAAMASVGGEGTVVNEVNQRLAAGTPIYYGGPPSTAAGGGIPRPGESGFRAEYGGPPAATAPAAPAPAPSPPPAGGGGINLGAGGAADSAFGGGGGFVTNPATSPPPGTNLTGAALDDYIRQHYGAMAWALDNPEIGPILRKAAHEGWDPRGGLLQSAIEATTWWKTHNATMRQIGALKASDPAEYARHIDTTAAALRDKAAQLGIPLTIDRSREIAQRSVDLGWDDNETNDALAAEFHYDPKVALRGQASQMAAAFRQQSRAFGVPITDGLAGGWVEGIIRGSMTEDDVTNYFQNQAKSRYPWMAKDIDAGVTPMDWFSPYISDAARLLERNPTEFDLNDPLILAAAQQVDPRTGERHPMSLYEYQNYLRSRPEWDRTHNARQEAAQFVGFLEQNMGLRV